MALPRSNRQLAEQWAEYVAYQHDLRIGLTDMKEPRSHAEFCNMSFNHGTAYSWVTPVAQYHKGAVYITDRYYSNSTTRQVADYMRAIYTKLGDKLPVFRVDWVANPEDYSNVQHYLSKAMEALDKVFEPRTQARANFGRIYQAELAINGALVLARQLGYSDRLQEDETYKKYLRLSQDDKVLAIQAAYAVLHGGEGYALAGI